MKYGDSEKNRENGTTLDLCVIENIWSDSKNDWVQYYYSHANRSPSYKAYLPLGNLKRLGLKIRKDVSRDDEEDQRQILLAFGG